jgi:hypothetical protein
MKRLLSVAVAAFLPLFTMEECDRGFIPVPAGGAPPVSRPAQGYSGTEPLAPSAMNATWNEPSGVGTKQASLAECQARADQYSRERGKTVVMANVIPAVKGWLCVFQEY